MTTARSFRTRALVVAASAATFAIAVAGPALSQDAPTGTGVAGLSIVPVAVDIDGLPVEVDTSIGTLLAEATNAGDPVARLALAGLAAGGGVAPDLAISSADGDKSGQEQREVAAAGATAALSLVDYAVESGADSAAARLGALAGSITTPLGLGADLDAQQVQTVASPTEAASSVVLTVSGLELGLGDLLPADLLDALPLSVVLSLVDSLGLPLPADVAGQLAALDTLVPTLEGAIATAEELAETQALLDAAVADVPEVVSAQQAVTDAEAAVAAAEATLADAEAEVVRINDAIAALEAELLTLDPIADALRILEIEAELAQLEQDLLAAEAAVIDAQAALAAAEQDLADAQVLLDAALAEAALLDPVIADLLDKVGTLEALLDDLLSQLDGLLGGLDLADLRLDLLGALTDTPLLQLGDIVLDLRSIADGVASSGTVTCSATGLTVLGSSVPTPDCNAVSAAFDGLGAAVTDALAALPVTAPVPAVTAGGLDMTASGAGSPDADGVTTASAKVSALTLGIAPVDLTATIDDLVAQLEALIADLDAAVTGIDLTDVLAAGQVQAAAVTVPTTLEGALGDLVAQLDLLPVGDALDGLSTLGLDAVLGAVELNSTFTPTSASGPATPDSPSGTPTSTGTPTGSLPRTGLELQTLFMAAIAAAAIGAVTMGLGRTVELQMQTADTDGD